MRCSRARSLLTALIDGVLNKDTRKHLESHLKACPECRDEFRELLHVHETMKAAYKFNAPEGFEGRVMAKLHAGKVTGDTFAGTRLLLWLLGGGSKSLKLAEAAAVILVILTGVVFGGFLSEKLFTGKNVLTAEAGPDYLFSLTSLRYLDPAPPDSIAGVYLAMKEGGDER